MNVLRYVIFAFFLCLMAGIAAAQDPLVELEFEENSTIPGQPLTLRLTVLVPTWLPKPVVFPTLEAPNILVQIPEGATGPVSRTIEGETWSGVSRRYRVTPMVPDQVQIPVQDLIVTWADPGKPDPLQQTIALDPIVIEGKLPEGAEDLTPIIAAQSLTLTQDVAAPEMPLKAGDSITVTLTAEIEGTSAMFLPRLLPAVDVKGIAAYPAEPIVSDKENRGKLSGTRTESITLVAQSGGGGAFPEIELAWYNLDSGKVETTQTEGFEITVDAPQAMVQNADPRLLVLYALGGVVMLAVLYLVYRRIAPKVRTLAAARRIRIEASEPWAYAKTAQAAKAHDYDRLMRALDIWAARCSSDPRAQHVLQSALSGLGAARYGAKKTSEVECWAAVQASLPQARAKARTSDHHATQLPPLNPTPSQGQKLA